VVTQLTDDAEFDGRARWSPDGSKIVFESNRDGDWEIFTMNADGTNVTQLTQNTTADWYADWSPDGNWITYVSVKPETAEAMANVTKTYEVFVIDINGQNQTRLTLNDGDDIQPRWTP
jgi:Tol biopolymer transport system component